MTFIDAHKLELSKLETLAGSNQFVFRRQAQDAFKSYSKSIRQLHKRLSTDTLSAFDFFVKWDEQLRAPRQQLTIASSATAFHNSLKKYLLLEPASSAELAQRLVQDRDDEIVEQFLDSVYSFDQSFPRSAADELLNKTADDIQREKQTYIDYELYRTVASKHAITIPDSHHGALRFYLQSRRAKKEIRRYTKLLKRRVQVIDRRQAELENVHKGLIVRLFALQLDVVEILAARHTFEKKFAALSMTARKSSTKRLAMFEAETKKIRDTYVEKIADTAKLASLQMVAKEIDDALIQVFDMSTAERNELMGYTKEYRDTSREKQQILDILR